MKKILLTVTVLAVAIFFAGCGGSGSTKSGLKNNEYLGSMPAFRADYLLTEKADEEKLEKAKATGDWNKLSKVAMKIEAEQKERKTKEEATLKAETQKLAGKAIPFKCSEEFKKMKCEIASVKVSNCENGAVRLVASVVAKDNFTLKAADKDNKEYENIFYRAYAKDGSTIRVDWFYVAANAQWGETKSYNKGQSIRFDGKDADFPLYLYKEPEKWVDFAGIEFITKEEYNKLNN